MIINCDKCGVQWDNESQDKCPICDSEETKYEVKEVKNGSKEFYRLLEEAANLHEKKSRDYTTREEPYGNYEFAGQFAKMFVHNIDSGLMGRFGEKLYRLMNLEAKDPVNERIEDTELDMIVIITLFVANRRERRMKEEQPSPSEEF